MILGVIIGLIIGILATLGVEAAAARWLVNRILKDFHP